MKKVFIVDGVAVVAADTVNLFDDYADVDVSGYDEIGNPLGGIRYLCFNKTSEILEVSDLPNPWIPHAYKLVEGSLVLDTDSVAWKESLPKKVVPESVTMRQARLALLSIGKLADVSVAIESLPSPQKEVAQIEFEFSSTVERHRPLVQSLGPLLGLSDEQLDDLFILAATL